MTHKLSRRDFLKATAAAMAAVSLASWSPGARRAHARSKLFTEGADTFNTVAAALPTGNAIMDISAGWDGTHWAVDSQGIPHVYDALQGQWQIFGRGVDAAIQTNNQFFLFRGDEVAIYTPATGALSTNTIAATWTQLPPMFTNDLDGAVYLDYSLFLIRSGRYVSVNYPTEPHTLSSLEFWPANVAPDGVVYRSGHTEQWGLLYVDPVQEDENSIGFVSSGGSGLLQGAPSMPIIDAGLSGQMVDIIGAGFDAFTMSPGDGVMTLFRGSAVWTVDVSGAVSTTSLGDLVPAWAPRLAHAPRGQVGNLWSLATDGTIVQHDGDEWTLILPPDGVTVTHVDVGQDGQPFALAQPASGPGSATLHAYDMATGIWQTPVALGSITPQQLSVGDATRVYVLGSDGAVNRLQDGAFVQVPELGSNVVHLAANHDGTVWHTDGTANSFRFISERSYPPTQLPVPNVSSVQKVTSTAYGNAMMLVQQNGANQLYTYTSPYLYKTSPSYVPIANGLVIQHPQVTAGSGLTYVNVGTGIVALDSHTGQELWSTLLPNRGECAAVVYDPVQQLIYATDNAQTLFALDANTGAEVWYFQTAAGPISQPALGGSGLCVVGAGTAYWIDTSAALAQGTAESVSAAWSTTLESDYFDFTGAVVLIYLDTIYVTLYYVQDNDPQQYLWSLSAHDGSGANMIVGSYSEGDFTVPAISTANWNSDDVLFLFNNYGVSMLATPVDPYFVNDPILRLPNNATFTQGLAVIDVADANVPGGRLHVLIAGGSDGNLYQLDLTKPFNDFPAFTQFNLQTPTGGGVIGAGPMAVESGDSSLLVFSLGLNGENSVVVVDPTTGSFLQVFTDHMLAAQLTVDSNGILYAAGQDPNDPSSPFGQVYAIRIDDLLQAERDFIVDSELMQDFDEDTPGQLTATARYQTHVTVVDANKAPRPYQSMKVWADASTTLLIDGQSYTVDATTPASVQTDATGTLTIVSDATDLTTSALKLWAGFMDPYERIVVYPDREFHNRLATTHYASTTNPDPTQINLATAAPYDPTNLTSPAPLFSSSQQPLATAAANVTSKLASSVAYQSGGTPAQASAAAATATASSYLAYADLAGAAYSPVSTPANRAVTPTASGGFSFDGTTLTELTPVTAAEAIDALEGTPDALPGSFVSWLRGLWDNIKNGLSTVEQVVVSIGRDIYAGIKYVADGVVKVLRVALRDIVDVAIAIGSVFVQLGKDIVKVAEALSIIFHLGQVIDTAQAIKATFAQMLGNLPSIIQGVQTQVNGIFATVETDLTNAFNGIIAALDGTVTGSGAQVGAAGGIGSLQGMGATPHTIFSVAPKGTQAQSSQAVPAMWGIHKLRQNYSKATPSATGASAAGAADSGLAATLQTFVDSLLSGGSNNAAYSQLNTGFHSSIRFNSAKDFFASLLADLLEALEALAKFMLGILQNLVDDVMSAAADIAALIQGAGNAGIPILSTLWHALTGETLTWLDLIAFVIAIPTTLIYRIVEGDYPAVQVTASGVTADLLVLQRVQGIAASITALVLGIVNAILDAAYVVFGELNLPIIYDILIVVLGLTTAFALVVGDVLETNFWVIAASVIGLVQTLLYSVPSLPPEVPSSLGLAFSPVLLWLFYQEYKAAQSPDALAFAANIVGEVPVIVNPIKFVPNAIVAAVAPVADLACGLAVTGLALADTIEGWDELTAPTALPETVEPVAPAPDHRVFLPTVHR